MQINNGFWILPGTMVLSTTIGQFDRPHGNTSVTRIVPKIVDNIFSQNVFYFIYVLKQGKEI